MFSSFLKLSFSIINFTNSDNFNSSLIRNCRVYCRSKICWVISDMSKEAKDVFETLMWLEDVSTAEAWCCWWILSACMLCNVANSSEQAAGNTTFPKAIRVIPGLDHECTQKGPSCSFLSRLEYRDYVARIIGNCITDTYHPLFNLKPREFTRSNEFVDYCPAIWLKCFILSVIFNFFSYFFCRSTDKQVIVMMQVYESIIWEINERNWCNFCNMSYKEIKAMRK